MEQQVGRYRIVSQLGRGSMGVVYLADDPLLSRQVAIKMVDVGVVDQSRKQFLHDRLLRDARAAAALSHPNIVTIYDVLEEGGKAYVVMEYIAGESLAMRLKRSQVPDITFTLRVLREMASALDYTHRHAIVHRDIKPGNVMIEAGGTAKIMDFGIARIHEGSGSTATGTVMGTIEYIAPEQLNSEHLDGKADQFSLAASAYRMMSGSTLFGQHSFATLAYKIAHETPAPATSRNAALPAAVDGVLAKALSREPAQRFASCGHFVEALEVAFAENIPVDEEVTRIAPVVKESERRWYAAKGLATHAASLARSSIAVGPFVLGLVKRSAMIFGSHGLWRRTRLAILAAVILGGGALILSRPWLTGKSAQKPAMQAYNRALELADHSREEDALPFLNKAIAIRPNFPEALMDRGRILCLRLHQEETAIKDFSEVIHLEPEYAWAYYRRGECYALVERYDLALADYNRALQLEPANHFFLVGRGIVFLRQKDYQKAITDFTEAIRIDPYGGLAYQKRSEAKKAVGDAAGAMADIDKAVELMTQQPPPADRR